MSVRQRTSDVPESARRHAGIGIVAFVAALALGGTVSVFENRAAHAASAQQSLERVAALHPHLGQEFARLLSTFDHGPVPTTIDTPDGRSVAVSMTRGDFGYACAVWPRGPVAADFHTPATQAGRPLKRFRPFGHLS